MSTKTSFKRIALVAASALAIAGFSAVPANAGASTVVVTTDSTTFAYGDAKTVPTVGSSVSIDAILAITANASAATNETATVTGTLTTIPNNSARTSSSIVAATTGAAAAYSAASAATNVLSFVQATAADKTGKLGIMTFTPDVPGKYVLTLTPNLGGTARTVEINVGGAALTQGNANLGSASTGTQIVGRTSTVTFNVPAGTASGEKIEISSTLPIRNVFSGTANLGASAAAHSSATGLATFDGISYAKGAIYTVQANVTASSTISSNNYPAAMEQVSVQVDSPAAASTQTVSFKSINAITGAVTTVGTATITYGSADLLTLSVANTTILKAKSTDAPDATSDAVAIVQSAAVGTQRANILVTIKNGNDGDLDDQNVTATIAGPGLIAWSASGTGSGTTSGSVTKDMGASENDEYLVVNGNGTGGVATITFTIGTTVLGTETITFYGSATKFTATTNIVAAANGTTSTDVVTVCAVDSANVAVPGTTIYGFSGDATVATMAESSDVTETAAITTSGTSIADHVAATAIGCVGFSITALSQTTKPSVVLTFGNASTIATSTVTTTASVNVGSVAATTVALASDAETYEAGSKITLTLTFKDSVGRPVAYGPGTGTLAAALTSSSNLNGAALFGTANISKLGVTTAVVYAPLSTGPVNITGTTGANATYLVTAAQDLDLALALAVEGDVTSSLALDAANAATDAAENAYDEAQNATQAASDALAAVTALAKQVKKLIKSVKKLSKAVARM